MLRACGPDADLEIQLLRMYLDYVPRNFAGTLSVWGNGDPLKQRLGLLELNFDDLIVLFQLVFFTVGLVVFCGDKQENRSFGDVREPVAAPRIRLGAVRNEFGTLHAAKASRLTELQG
jgi:hypothetical protein